MARKLVLSLVAIAVFFSFSLRAAASPIEAPATAFPAWQRSRARCGRVVQHCTMCCAPASSADLDMPN
jgi:hypothetical protein